MKKKLVVWMVGLLAWGGVLMAGAGGVRADEVNVKAYLFWGQGCPHCADMEEFLESYDWSDYGLEIKTLEIYRNRENARLMGEVGQSLGVASGGVPFLVIGDEAIVGYAKGVTDRLIAERVEECARMSCTDVVESLLAGKRGVVMERLEGTEARGEAVAKEQEGDESEGNGETKGAGLVVGLPWAGEVDVGIWSLPLLTVVLGLLDGFNPCAMWVLVFLIGLLMSMEDVRRRWILGLTFIGATGVVYLLFLTAWLNFFLVVGFLWWVRLAIGLVAIGSGLYHLKEYYEKTTACKVIDPEKRKRVFGRLENITKSQSLAAAMAGIVLLAVSVNVVELVCSAGLPAIFTNVLSMSALSWWEYAGYLLLYVAMFVLDDVLVFVGAMKAMQLVGTNEKYTRWSNLVGGVVIGILGILLIFKPEWLMGG